MATLSCVLVSRAATSSVRPTDYLDYLILAVASGFLACLGARYTHVDDGCCKTTDLITLAAPPTYMNILERYPNGSYRQLTRRFTTTLPKYWQTTRCHCCKIYHQAQADRDGVQLLCAPPIGSRMEANLLSLLCEVAQPGDSTAFRDIDIDINVPEHLRNGCTEAQPANITSSMANDNYLIPRMHIRIDKWWARARPPSGSLTPLFSNGAHNRWNIMALPGYVHRTNAHLLLSTSAVAGEASRIIQSDLAFFRAGCMNALKSQPMATTL
ncbi:hypothetical protein MGYG_06948 [Nannizzia gypsea CBS 118893]|uniref:Uncharacterized protein n=1 Tax=Arthroderma gypseum (strain ATCC MYA-4604 / CBS 118893) TaxID=535722 RepID=E4V1N4_ARTGP|nr:hypothetical protein MGYG_06948 [Nannizzia gypsea CBS 118893]EFR03949.1 hypothetical protein MGYG_06948 [Nannizzia gypsea CBS 118893]